MFGLSKKSRKKRKLLNFLKYFDKAILSSLMDHLMKVRKTLFESYRQIASDLDTTHFPIRLHSEGYNKLRREAVDISEYLVPRLNRIQYTLDEIYNDLLLGLKSQVSISRL